jgi:hypothetical protein
MNPLDMRWDEIRERWPIRVVNSSGEAIPGYSVMRITNWSKSNNEIVCTVAKPDATYRWQYLVSWPITIGSSSTSEGLATYLHKAGLVYYNSGTPALGERWGPTPSQWYLTQHAPGFIVQGSTTNTFNSKTQLCAVQVPPGEVRVQNDDGSGSFAAGATGRTFGIYGGTAGTTDTGLEVTLNNGSTTAWAATKYGWATADAGGAIWGAPHQT